MNKILIVEDDQILLSMYQHLFTTHGYQVKVARDGESGLEQALSEHPDLILLDLNLPKLDGITVMHRLRTDTWGKNASIIILTNLDTDEQRLAAVTTDQPAYYLVKANTSPEEVLEKVKEVLNSQAKALADDNHLN